MKAQQPHKNTVQLVSLATTAAYAPEGVKKCVGHGERGCASL